MALTPLSKRSANQEFESARGRSSFRAHFAYAGVLHFRDVSPRGEAWRHYERSVGRGKEEIGALFALSLAAQPLARRLQK